MQHEARMTPAWLSYTGKRRNGAHGLRQGRHGGVWGMGTPASSEDCAGGTERGPNLSAIASRPALGCDRKAA